MPRQTTYSKAENDALRAVLQKLVNKDGAAAVSKKFDVSGPGIETLLNGTSGFGPTLANKLKKLLPKTKPSA